MKTPYPFIRFQGEYDRPTGDDFRGKKEKSRDTVPATIWIRASKKSLDRVKPGSFRKNDVFQ